MSLILDNCHAASESKVRKVKCPKPDGRWHPISHGKAIDLAMEGIERAGLKVTDASFALGGNKKQGAGDTRLFGELTLAAGDRKLSLPDDFTMAIGVRNSVDKSIPFNLCGGERVMVCGNLAFNGEFMVKRRHTINIMDQITGMVDNAIESYVTKFDDRVKEIELWKTIGLEAPQADHTIMECIRAGAIKPTHIPAVLGEWNEPKHPEFKDRNVWSLFNAFTEFHKTRRGDPNDLADYSMVLNRTFRKMYDAEFEMVN
jgi:hypothetical protein